MSTEGFLENFKGHHIFVAMKEYNAAPWHYHKSYELSKEALQEKNKEGWGIFFTVNLLDESLDEGRHRTKKMVQRCRAVFMDDDIPRDGARTDFPIVPSIIVNSSPGKYHYYWLTDTDKLDEWSKVQNSIISTYDGDNNAKDLTRYLRLPGYNHNKKEGFMVPWEGDGIVYPWENIVKAFPPSEKAPKGNIATIAAESKTIKQYKEDIRIGKDYHGSLTSLCHQMKMEGQKDDFIVMALEGAMLRCTDELKSENRWQSRFEDITRDVENYNPEQEEIDLPAVPKDIGIEGEMPWPPGLFGELSKSAYNMARFQYREVAIVSALGLIAGICGRKFNAEDAGLNVYITLIMDTGMGKDSINKFITRTLNSVNDLGTGSSFIGPVRFTGPKSVYNSLESARSQVCVFTEAGLLLNSKAGDRDGLKRMLLGLYTQSGQHDFSGAEMYSDNDKSIKALRAPALTIINESTPDMLLSVFKQSDGLTSGDVPRQLIYRIIRDKPPANRKAYNYSIDKICIDKLNHLVSKCSSVQAVDDPKAWNMIPGDDVDEDMELTEKHYIKMQNDNRMSNTVKHAMASRAYYKAVRLAAIASVFNHKDEAIYMPEWLWAKSMIEYEMKGLQTFFQGGGMDDQLSDLTHRVVGVQILKILHNEIKVRKGLANKDHKAGKFKYYELTQALKNNKELTALNDDVKIKSTPEMGLEKVIKYMTRQGLIFKVENTRAYVLQVTETFLIAYGESK